MKLTKTYEITVKGKTKRECEQVFEMIKSIVDLEMVEIKGGQNEDTKELR